MSETKVSSPFSVGEYRERLDNVKSMMDKAGVEGLLITAPENIYYLTGYDSIGYYLFQCLIVSLDKPEPILLTHQVEEAQARSTWLKDIRILSGKTPPQNPAEDTAEEIRGLGLDGKTIGIEADDLFLPISIYQRLTKLTNSKFTNATQILGDVRLVKSSKEIRYIRKASEIADIGMKAAYESLRPGIRECELASEISKALYVSGGEYPGIPVLVASGPDSRPHKGPTERVVGAGEAVFMEFGGVYKRYNSCILRTVAIGRPSKGLTRVHAASRRALEAGISEVLPGVPVAKVDAAVKKVLRSSGLPQQNLPGRTGYGVGIGYPPRWMESLSVSGTDPHVLQPGMALMIEGAMVVDGIGSAIIGDIVLVTPGGCEVLFKSPRELEIP